MYDFIQSVENIQWDFKKPKTGKWLEYTHQYIYKQQLRI